MERIWRRLSFLLTGGSLLLSVATVALWIRTYFASDELAYYRPTGLGFVTEPNPSDRIWVFNYHSASVAGAGYHLLTARGEIGFYVPNWDFLPSNGKRWAKMVGAPGAIPFPDPPGAFGFYASGGTAMKTDSADPSAAPIGDFLFGARYFFVPLWFIAAVFAVPPMIGIWRRLRDRNRAA